LLAVVALANFIFLVHTFGLFSQIQRNIMEESAKLKVNTQQTAVTSTSAVIAGSSSNCAGEKRRRMKASSS
jgi:hypothetical protein